ncbi:hypothetical protein HPP92_021423 [Vanilla planifolia]|uniref:Uncharacterized protein n=1 Tax=Vanilla planifolia TaxID=51239 RepID=A0A835Q4T8_VANPL|nr:hypothetical protein HPP92_021423 [Vanilla planifolia]
MAVLPLAKSAFSLSVTQDLHSTFHESNWEEGGGGNAVGVAECHYNSSKVLLIVHIQLGCTVGVKAAKEARYDKSRHEVLPRLISSSYTSLTNGLPKPCPPVPARAETIFQPNLCFKKTKLIAVQDLQSLEWTD